MSVNELCIFCARPWGEVKHSAQHILGLALRKHASSLPSSRTWSSGSLLFDPETQLFVANPLTDPLVRDSSLLNLRTRAVCEDCNTGWMRRLEEEATPLFLRLVDAAQDGTRAILSRAEARTFARFAQNMALAHELTTGAPRVGNSSMGNRLRLAGAVPGSTVWLTRNDNDLEIQIRQARVGRSDTPVVLPGDPERLSLLVALSWRYLSVFVYVLDLPILGPRLPVNRWVLARPCGASGIDFPPIASLSLAELNATLSEHQR